LKTLNLPTLNYYYTTSVQEPFHGNGWDIQTTFYTEIVPCPVIYLQVANSD